MGKFRLDPDLESASVFEEDENSDVASAIAPDDEPSVVRVNRKLFTRSNGGVDGFCIVPFWVVREIAQARAYHAAPFVFAILQRVRMKKIVAVPITAAIWAQIASPSPHYARQVGEFGLNG